MIFFVTVNYYSIDLVESLIKSIRSNILVDYRIIIVNNSDDDFSLCEFIDDSVSIIDSGTNLGFGAGCNLAISAIFEIDRNALIWLINPDATIEKDADQYILECIRNEPLVSILGTQIQDSNKNIWFSEGSFNKWTGYLGHSLSNENSDTQRIGITKCRWVCGCSMIINLSQFDHCPQFDPNYFLYAEDADLCERYYQQNYYIAVTNRVLVTHQVSSVIGKDKKNMYFQYTFSRLYFLRCHSTFLGMAIYMAYLIFKILLTLPSNAPNALGRLQGFQKFLNQIIQSSALVR
ncbi:MAG: glycosyltransferase family 2 protein [Pseudanabaena sp. CAN_BIN31]|nr:glycosyltransferase family 2 protein [Pseudanabaena sp. CAN_BIN31]